METKTDYIARVLNEARLRGLCKSQKEFAELLGMNPSTISNALKGDERYLTKTLLRRIELWESQVLNGPMGQQPVQAAEPQKQDIIIPAATMELYTSMAKSIDRLTALVERLQPGASAFSVQTYGQKNFLTEGK